MLKPTEVFYRINMSPPWIPYWMPTGLCHTEVLGIASVWGRDLTISTMEMQLLLNPVFLSESQGGVQNVGLARSQKTFCFLAFSPSCSNFGQAASFQCASLMPEQPLHSSGIIFILVLMTSSFFREFWNLPEKSRRMWGYWRQHSNMRF